MIRPTNKLKVHAMAGKGYKIIELVGSSPDGWEEAVKQVVDTASTELTNMRIAEVMELDTRLEDGKIAEYRAKVRLSFKVEREPETL
jgi:flavin-binding protein dodecin